MLAALESREFTSADAMKLAKLWYALLPMAIASVFAAKSHGSTSRFSNTSRTQMDECAVVDTCSA